MHPNLVNYALSYAEHGFSVIPIGNNKRPLIKFANKPPLTNTEIREIWQKYPTANIALKTDKFFVIDVDRHGGEDGMKSIKTLNHDEWFKVYLFSDIFQTTDLLSCTLIYHQHPSYNRMHLRNIYLKSIRYLLYKF